MNVLILGYGSIGAKHLESCQRVFSNNQYALLRFSNTQKDSPKNVRVFTSPEEVKDFAPDIVFVCTPTAHHAASVRKIENFLPSNCAFFLEKPLAHTKEDLSYFEALLKKFSYRFSYGCVFRHHPVAIKIQSILQGKGLGAPISYTMVCASYLPDWRPNQDYRKNYSAKKAMGGGVTLDLIHEFDLAEFYFGTMEKISGFHGKVSTLEIDSDDLCLAQASHKSIKGSIQLNYFSRKSRRDVEIYCENGVITGNYIDGTVTITSDGGKPETISCASTRDKLFDTQTHSIFENMAKSNSSYFKEALSLNTKLLDFLAEEKA